MSSPQKLLFLCTALIAVAMVLYPPWTEFYFTPEGGVGRTFHGYHWLWDKPANTPGMTPKGAGVRIYSGRLSPQLIGLIVVTFVAYVALGRKRAQNHPQMPQRKAE